MSLLQITLALFLFCSSLLHASFEKTLTKEKVSFKVQVSGEGSLKTLTVTPMGFKNLNKPFSNEIEGTVTGVKIADLDDNGYPEIYIFVTSAGSGSYGSVLAYASNANKSISKIYMIPLENTPKAMKGYMGHDRFSLKKNMLVRQFPIYGDNDPNCCPKGGIRTIYYKLVPGEAVWQLVIDHIEERKK